MELSDTELDILVKRTFDPTTVPPDYLPPCWVRPLLSGMLVNAGYLPKPVRMETAWAAYHRYVRKRFNGISGDSA